MGSAVHGCGRLAPLAATAVILCLSVIDANSIAHAGNAASQSLQEQGNALMKNVEEMVAHGGMGDAEAILHHCREAAHVADRLITQIPLSDPRHDRVVPPLRMVIHQCDRVSQMGRHADPGRLLNPAVKARAAARESMELLGLARIKQN